MEQIRHNKIIYVKQTSCKGESSGTALHFNFACDKTRTYLKKFLKDVEQMIDKCEQQTGKRYNESR